MGSLAVWDVFHNDTLSVPPEEKREATLLMKHWTSGEGEKLYLFPPSCRWQVQARPPRN